MDILKTLLTALAGRPGAKKYLLYAPLAAMGVMVALVNARGLVRGEEPKAWIDAILIWTAQWAPFVVKNALWIAFGVLFLSICQLLIAGLLSKKISKVNKDRNEKIQEVELFIIVIAMGIVGLFAFPYMPDIQTALWNKAHDMTEVAYIWMAGLCYLIICMFSLPYFLFHMKVEVEPIGKRPMLIAGKNRAGCRFGSPSSVSRSKSEN